MLWVSRPGIAGVELASCYAACPWGLRRAPRTPCAPTPWVWPALPGSPAARESQAASLRFPWARSTSRRSARRRRCRRRYLVDLHVGRRCGDPSSLVSGFRGTLAAWARTPSQNSSKSSAASLTLLTYPDRAEVSRLAIPSMRESGELYGRVNGVSNLRRLRYDALKFRQGPVSPVR